MIGKRKAILKLINSLYVRLDKSAKEIKHTFDEEKVHCFRVNYKKIRSFHYLLRSCEDNRYPKIHFKLRKYYHYLGELRDLQLTYTKISSAPYSEVQELCVSKIQKIIDDQKRLIARFDLQDIIHTASRKAAMHIPSLSFVDILIFQSNEWELIKTCTINPNSDAKIHTVRKSLKRLYYVNSILQNRKDLLFPHEDWQGHEEKFFIQLMKELGDYNDICIAIDIMIRRLIQDPEGPYSGYLEDSLTKWLNTKNDHYLLLVQKLKTQIFPEMQLMTDIGKMMHE